MRTTTVSWVVLSLAAVGPSWSLLSCSSDGGQDTPEPISSRSYQGHENDLDTNNLVGAYPALVGTRLDDCQTCHAGRVEEGRLVGSAWDHCHDLLRQGTGHVARETLNGFGLDYLEAGRTREALNGIGETDSDGDGFSNGEELAEGRYPGSGSSRPGQVVAPLLTVTLDELRALPSHSQLMLVNPTQQPFDDYVTYRGVRVRDLLAARGIDITGATGITVIAPDGYQKSLPVEYVDRSFPRPLFYGGLDAATLGEECGFVRYPEALPAGVVDGAPTPGELWLLLGYEREGAPLDPSSLDAAAGTLTGEGPLRLVVPQTVPGRPDRGSRASPTSCGDGLDFREEADHNAGSMVRGVIALRIDPMPEGVEEFDFMNGGWAYVDAGHLILYGYGVR